MPFWKFLFWVRAKINLLTCHLNRLWAIDANWHHVCYGRLTPNGVKAAFFLYFMLSTRILHSTSSLWLATNRRYSVIASDHAISNLDRCAHQASTSLWVSFRVCPPWERLSLARLDSSHAGDRSLWAELSKVCCSSGSSNGAKRWKITSEGHKTTGAATHPWASNSSSHSLNSPALIGITRPAGNQFTLATTCKDFPVFTHISMSSMCKLIGYQDTPARWCP